MRATLTIALLKQYEKKYSDFFLLAFVGFETDIMD